MRRTFVLLLVASIAFTGMALASEGEQHEAAFVIAGSRAMPEYPPAALAAGFEGIVTVAAVINEDGSVGAVEVVESTSSKLGFEEAAMDAFRHWQFAPALQGGDPVVSVWIYDFQFSTPGGRLNPSPYVSGSFAVSVLAAPGAGSSKGDRLPSDGQIGPNGKSRRPRFSTPNKIPCRELGCMYDRTKLLAPQVRSYSPSGSGAAPK